MDCGKYKKTSEDCTNLAHHTKIAAKATYACTVESFISIYEQKILTMWQNLETEDFISIIYECALHYLNILCKNVTTDSVMGKVVKIQIFRNPHMSVRVY